MALALQMLTVASTILNKGTLCISCNYIITCDVYVHTVYVVEPDLCAVTYPYIKFVLLSLFAKIRFLCKVILI